MQKICNILKNLKARIRYIHGPIIGTSSVFTETPPGGRLRPRTSRLVRVHPLFSLKDFLRHAKIVSANRSRSSHSNFALYDSARYADCSVNYAWREKMLTRRQKIDVSNSSYIRSDAEQTSYMIHMPHDSEGTVYFVLGFSLYGTTIASCVECRQSDFSVGSNPRLLNCRP